MAKKKYEAGREMKANHFQEIDYSKLFKTILLERVRRCVAMKVDPHFMDSARFTSEYSAHIMEAITLRLMADIYAETPQQIEVSYPATWLDAFKERWFPKWALRKCRVKYTRKIMEARHYYPSITAPEHQSVLAMRIFTPPALSPWQGDQQ